MTIETDILNALMKRLIPTEGAVVSDITSPGTPVASPLVRYTPTVGVKYLAVHPVLRAAPQDVGVSFTGACVVHRGIFQVDAVVPEGQGEAPGLRLAALVAARFAIGTSLVAGSYKLQILQTPTIAAAVMDAPWVRFPVSIPYTLVN